MDREKSKRKKIIQLIQMIFIFQITVRCSVGLLCYQFIYVAFQEKTRQKITPTTEYGRGISSFFFVSIYEPLTFR